MYNIPNPFQSKIPFLYPLKILSELRNISKIARSSHYRDVFCINISLWIFKRLNAVVVDMFKVISRSSRKRCEICPVISIKASPYLGCLSCWLWTNFTTCSSYFIIKFNLVTLFQVWSPGGNYLIYRQNSWKTLVKEFNISKFEGSFKKFYDKYTHF